MLKCLLQVYATFLIMTFKLTSLLLSLTLITSYSPSSVSVPDTCSQTQWECNEQEGLVLLLLKFFMEPSFCDRRPRL